MPDYLITWVTEHWATCPHEAAERAWQDRSASGSIANQFTVTDQATQHTTTIDLSVSGICDEPGREPYLFTAEVSARVRVLAANRREAERLLGEVDFDVQPVGGPVRLGLVTTYYRSRVEFADSGLAGEGRSSEAAVPVR